MGLLTYKDLNLNFPRKCGTYNSYLFLNATTNVIGHGVYARILTGIDEIENTLIPRIPNTIGIVNNGCTSTL